MTGVVLALACAAGLLRLLNGDLGNSQLHVAGAALGAAPASLFAFTLIGTAIAAAGAWSPARAAAGQAPARALKGGDQGSTFITGKSWIAGLGLLAAGQSSRGAPHPRIAVLRLCRRRRPSTRRRAARTATHGVDLRIAPRTSRVVPDTALAQLRDNIPLSTLSLASVIVSFSLMVAMAIMVFSFRVSFEDWLGKLLPADLQLREALGNDTAYWSPQDQQAAAAVAGVARVEFRRTRPLLLDPARPPVTLIARGASARQVSDELPLLQTFGGRAPDDAPPVWISESVHDLYGYEPGTQLSLPLGGQMRHFTVAGIWRDYARVFGAVVITRPAYIAATHDADANKGSVWLKPGSDAAHVESELRVALARGASASATASAFEVLTSTALRERSLRIFDRAFAITYGIEAVAVIIGLMGVSFAASSTALARRAEFGMLRHIGMLRRQVIAMLATEGVLMSSFGVLYGLILGGALSLVLVYVVNRQSFNWSIDFAVPLWRLAVLSLTLIAAAALTAVWSGRSAMSHEAVRAVREDW